MQAAGCSCYDPLVVDMLMHFSSHYIDDVAAEALSYCTHAGREQIERSDIMLVLQARADMMFTRPPPREVFGDIARCKNSERLRFLPENKEQQLPHIEHDCRMTIDCEYVYPTSLPPPTSFRVTMVQVHRRERPQPCASEDATGTCNACSSSRFEEGDGREAGVCTRRRPVCRRCISPS